jgi:hypothetical protein
VGRVVVRKLRQGQELAPIILLIIGVDPEVLLEGLVDSLGLTVRLWVVGGGEI